MKTLQFECQKIALKQDASGFVLTTRIHPDDIPEELLRDFVGARYICVLVRVGDHEEPVVYNNRVQKAGILCRDLNFQQWAFEEFNAEDIGERDATETVYNYCGIRTRSALATNVEAQKLFDELVGKYEQYKKSL